MKKNVEEHREDSSFFQYRTPILKKRRIFSMLLYIFLKEKRKKISLGGDCCAYRCPNTFYNSDGVGTRLHFFKFHQNNPEKQLWCNC